MHVSIPSPIELVPTVQYLLGIEVIIAGFNTGFFYHSVLDWSRICFDTFHVLPNLRTGFSGTTDWKEHCTHVDIDVFSEPILMFALIQLLQALWCYDRREIMRSLLCGCRLFYKSISIYCNGLVCSYRCLQLHDISVEHPYCYAEPLRVISMPFVSSPGVLCMAAHSLVNPRTSACQQLLVFSVPVIIAASQLSS